MSGFVVAYKSRDKQELERMFEPIGHRGPHLSGISAYRRILMAQNYLKADVAADQEKVGIPISVSNGEGLKICYDGQMGNWSERAKATGTPDGAFREERLLLNLYRQFGNRMCQYLDDAIFAFVISDGDILFAARDLLGIKPLYYGKKDETIYLSSELKSLTKVTDDVFEFPPGHYMDETGKFTRFAELPDKPPEVIHTDLNDVIDTIRDIIQRSIHNRVDFSRPTGSLLSGGIDSSVIACLVSEAYRERFGKDSRIQTFAVGVGESEDILKARLMASHIKSDHHEVIVDLFQLLNILPEVIYHLESFDPPLVRSSVSNYLISRYAKEKGVEVLLSGEGGDEIFCGYLYMKSFSSEELFSRQMECIGFLHNNASLRLDRMNLCNSIRVVAPLVSGELLNYAMRLPPEYKIKPEKDQKIEKWIFRKAFEAVLPKEVAWRIKQEFSQGSGSADVLPGYFEDVILDEELLEAQASYPMVRSKEELFYFRIFIEHFGNGRAVDTVGQWLFL